MGIPSLMISRLPFVYILTLNWNNSSATADFLSSCAMMTYPNFRVVVIDNGSATGSLDLVTVQVPTTTLVVNASNIARLLFKGRPDSARAYAYSLWEGIRT